jgi:hypothetical protein
MAGNGRRKGLDALALALAGGETLRDAARLAGVGERTATRRWADPEFRSRVWQLRTEMVSRSLGRLVDGMAEGAETLRALLRAESESVRLGAVRALLELTLRVKEHTEMEERLRNLESRMAAADKDNGTPS